MCLKILLNCIILTGIFLVIFVGLLLLIAGNSSIGICSTAFVSPSTTAIAIRSCNETTGASIPFGEKLLPMGPFLQGPVACYNLVTGECRDFTASALLIQSLGLVFTLPAFIGLAVYTRCILTNPIFKKGERLLD